MRFHLYYDYGSCHMGDHNSGLESFSTREELEERKNEIEQREGSSVYFVVIEGDILE